MSLADGRELFVKHREGAPAGMYAAEASGLAWLAAPAALRTPAVVAVGDERRPASSRSSGSRPAGPRPATTRPSGAASPRSTGPAPPPSAWPRTTSSGACPSATGSPARGPDYGEHRLEPLARMAADAGTLGPGFLAGLERLRARLPDLTGPPEPPARLHGDLWGGNAMTAADGAPILIDPAVYGGHREIDLAMMRLFGGFSPTVFAAYAEAHPLADGHEDRVELYQLYPILVHVVLFGGGYARSAERILRRYAS